VLGFERCPYRDLRRPLSEIGDSTIAIIYGIQSFPHPQLIARMRRSVENYRYGYYQKKY